jgi:RNA-binding protein Musashi
MLPIRPLAELGKVFVGGLSRDTTTTGLRVYFERFGQISDCVVMKDRSTGAPRGFGFVTYRNQTIADHVVSQRHLIDGKEVEAKPAVPRDSETLLRAVLAGQTIPGGLLQPAISTSAGQPPQPGELKIFVGGLSHETSELEFVSHFGTLRLPCTP